MRFPFQPTVDLGREVEPSVDQPPAGHPVPRPARLVLRDRTGLLHLDAAQVEVDGGQRLQRRMAGPVADEVGDGRRLSALMRWTALVMARMCIPGWTLTSGIISIPFVGRVASAMPAIHIRELSRSTLDRLKARARRHDRSLQAELKSILEEAAETDWSGTRALAAKLRKSLAGRTHSDSAELIASDRRSR